MSLALRAKGPWLVHIEDPYSLLLRWLSWAYARILAVAPPAGESWVPANDDERFFLRYAERDRYSRRLPWDRKVIDLRTPEILETAPTRLDQH